MDNMVSKPIAIIPARGGSKRLPKKNIIDFLGKPMIAWTIEAAIESGIFQKVIVSTDSTEIAEISINYGAEVPFLRETKNDDFSPVSEATIAAISQLKNLKFNNFDVVVQLMPNCPLRSSCDIKEQFLFFEKQALKLSIISAFKYGMFNPWWAHYKDNQGCFRRLFADQMNFNKRSQDLPELFCPSGAIWISTVKKLIDNNSFYCEGYKFFELPWERAVDIDDEADLKIAKLASTI